VIAVIGGGAWGTALANAAALAGRSVVLWMRDREAAACIAASRESARYLPGIRLPPSVRVAADPDEVRAAGAALLVAPAPATADLAAGLVDGLDARQGARWPLDGGAKAGRGAGGKAGRWG